MRKLALVGLSQLKSKAIALFLRYRLLVLAFSIIFLFFGGFVLLAYELKKDVSLPAVSSNDQSSGKRSSPSHLTQDLMLATAGAVLGLSDEEIPTPASQVSKNYYVVPSPWPTFATPTDIPSSIPVSTSTTSSCAGKANEDKSQVYVSSATTLVGTAVTISVELIDCYGNHVSNDNLKIALSSGDSNVKVNDKTLPLTIQAKDGKASFSVNSTTTGTYTFTITDTSQSFTVTMPGYHNPSVTFANNTSGNSNCTTAAGVPNSWYSDVYVSSVTNTSARFTVAIRDCNKNPVSNDALTISLSSGDSSVRADGNSLPFSISVQNGEIGFTVSSPVATTATFVVKDTTSSFTVTDPNNANPTVTFTGPAAPAPTDVPTPEDTVTPTAAPTTAPTDVPASTSSSSSSSSSL